MTSEIEMDYPFHAVFGRLDLAEADAKATMRKDFLVRLDGRVVGRIPRKVPGYSPAFDVEGGQRIGPAFDLDRLRKRVISAAFGGDEEAFRRATVA